MVIELITSLLLPDFPSGSGITLYKGHIYVIGDDANTILVLDSEYNVLDNIRLFNFEVKRIPKADKPDFETSLILQSEGRDYLLVLGSASRPNRETGLLLDLANSTTKTIRQLDLSEFTKRLKQLPIGALNIEGSTVINNFAILSNRANHSNPKNSLIITSTDFWKSQETAPISVLTLDLSVVSNKILGVSELCYVKEKDFLLLTLTSEITSNTYDDGIIGDSYLGRIDNISKKINNNTLELDGKLNLSIANEAFTGEKIEGILVERIEDDAMIIHLVSDNDQGQSRLFKIKMFR